MKAELRIHSVSGLCAKTNAFDHTDPYVTFSCCGQTGQTKVKKDAGSEAEFNESFVLDIPTCDRSTVVFMVKDSSHGHDKILAIGELPVQGRPGFNYSGPYRLENKHKCPEPSVVVSFVVS